MRNYEIAKWLTKVRAALEDLRPFLESISTIASHANSIKEGARLIAEGGANIGGHASQLHNHLNAAARSIAKMSARKFYDSWRELRTLLLSIEEISSSPSHLVSALIDELDKLSDLYDQFLSSQTGNLATQLIFQASAVEKRVEGFLASLDLVADIAGLTTSGNEEEGELSLYLPADLEFRDFIGRLGAIESLYSELCQLLNVSESDEPLQIAKIESGSLWAKIFGNSRVMSLMDDFLRASAHFMHRTYTREGQIASIPTKLEVLDQVLAFSAKLEEAGVDSTSIKDELAKGAVRIAKDLNRLLDHQPSITINEETIQLSASSDPHSLEYRQPRKLGNNSRSANSSLPE